MPAASYSKHPPSPDERKLLESRMQLLADRNPGWGIPRDDYETLWPYFAAQRITYLYDDELKESMVLTDSKLTGKGEELLDAYMLLDEDDEIQLKLWQFKYSTKWTGGVSTKELYAFVDRMNRVFLKTDLQDEETLSAYREIQQEIAALRESRGGRRKRLKVQCYFVTNGQSLSPSDAPKVDQLRDTYAYDRQTYGFTFEVYSGNDLYHLCAHGRIPIQEEVLELNHDMGDQSFLFHNIGQNPSGMPIKLAVGFVNVHQLIRLVDRYSNNELFERNVRFFLGPGRGVNPQIIDTVTSNRSAWFGFMNNGVSIVADEMEILRPAGGGKLKVRVNNMQIINGCQTVNALYHARHSAELKDRFQGNSNVMVRIYQVDPANEAFLNALIIATNSQSAIRPEDLLANEPRQKAAQAILQRYGVFYQRKDGEEPVTPVRVTSFSKEQAGLAWLAVFRGRAAQLRNSASKREVFRETSSDYEDIFNSFSPEAGEPTERRRGLEFVLACQLQQNISAKIEATASTRRERGPLKKATYYLSYAVYRMEAATFDLKLEQSVLEEPAPVIVRTIQQAVAEAVNRRFSDAVNVFTRSRDAYLEEKGGSEDAALKNQAFGETMRVAVEELLKNLPVELLTQQ
jgi:hypothetical protein